MAIANNFFAAAYPEPWQVLGVKLRPFSLGHYLKLSRLGCAFVSDKEETATLSDLLLGVVVCSMPTTPVAESDPFWLWLARQRGGWRYRVYSLAQRLRRKPVASPADYDAYLWGKRIGEIDLPSKVKMFADYIEKHSAAPAYVEEHKTTAPKISGAHWTQSVLSCLVAKCGYTMEEALNVPVSRALSDFLKQAESDGAVRLLPEEALA
jgi:hypothetical protein